jgi:hypothetical protein
MVLPQKWAFFKGWFERENVVAFSPDCFDGNRCISSLFMLWKMGPKGTIDDFIHMGWKGCREKNTGTIKAFRVEGDAKPRDLFVEGLVVFFISTEDHPGGVFESIVAAVSEK